MALAGSRAALVLAMALGALGAAPARRIPRLFHGGAAPVRVGPPPHGVVGTDAEACAECHAEIAREWRGSLHAAAWTDEVFQAAYAIEPLAFCRNCHAPRTRPGGEPSPRAAREGVSCAVCHVRAGAVLGAGRGGGDAPGRRAPHPVLAVRAFATSAVCADCHQFNFPGDAAPGSARFGRGEPMQDTYEEWAASDAAARGAQCQDCHMRWRADPDGARHRSHAFPGGRDPALVARAVRVEVAAGPRGADGTIEVTARVGAGDAGHAFPTGDLFRRAELVVWAEGDEAGARRVGFARVFDAALVDGPRGGLAFARHEVADTRVPPPGAGPPRVLTLRVPAPPGATTVRWALDHLLMPTPQAASQGFGPARNRLRVLEGAAASPPPGGAP